MAELTVEQRKVLALAAARKRAADAAAPKVAEAPAQDKPGLWDQISGFASGISQGIDDVPNSILEMGARGLDATGLTDNAYEAAHENNKRISAALHPAAQNGTGGAAVGRFGGQVAITAPLAAMRLPMLARAPALLRATLNGATQGAASGALTSSTTEDPLADKVGMGAAVGAALPTFAKGAAAVIKPRIAPAVQALLDRKIPLTIGQTLGGVARDLEDKATSLPLVGATIKRAQGRAVEGLNRAAFDDVLKPVGEKLPSAVSVGREAVEFTGDRLGQKYESALTGLKATVDQQFVSDLTAAIQRAKGALPEAQFKRFESIVRNQIIDKAGNGNAIGATFEDKTLQGINSELRRLGGGYRSDPSFDNRELGGVLDDVQNSFRSLISRSNPGQSDKLKAADAAWARFARVRDAAGRVGAREGVFTAPQLQSAVRAGDKSAGKGRFASGKALMQDLSDPAVEVLPSTIPDSGTAGRGLLGAVLLDGAAHVNPSLILPGLLAAGAYSGPGQALARAAITKRPKGAEAIARILRAKAGAVAPAAGIIDQAFLNRREPSRLP